MSAKAISRCGLDSSRPAPQGGDRQSRCRDRLLGWYLEHVRQQGQFCGFETSGRGTRSERDRVFPRREPFAPTPGSMSRPWCGAAGTRPALCEWLPGGERRRSGSAQFDDPKADLQLGHIPGAAPFQGELADVRLYSRPLDEAEIQALVQPGKQFVQPNPETKPRRDADPGRAAILRRVAAAGVPGGPARCGAAARSASEHRRPRNWIAWCSRRSPPGSELAKRFLAFEKRSPRLGVHLGLRRDCGSTLAPGRRAADGGRREARALTSSKGPSAISPARRWRRTT